MKIDGRVVENREYEEPRKAVKIEFEWVGWNPTEVSFFMAVTYQLIFIEVNISS